MPDNPSGQLSGGSGIGALRSRVTLYRRDQRPGADSAIAERLVRIAEVQASVEPTYASTFYASAQVDTPITHMVTVRWLDYPANVHVVVRSTLRPVPRTELFRVRRTKEVAGRKRFLQMECELEHSVLVPDDSDATRNLWLTEPFALPRTIWDAGETAWDNADTLWDSP